MKKVSHVLIIASALFLILGLPGILHAKGLAAAFGEKTDAVSSASLNIPDKPSGEYLVYINKENHRDTLQEWSAFFREEPVGVIFEDITCTVADSDAAGIEMAERYMARLAGNQMKIRREESALAASKLQWGKCDIFIVSSEMADVLHTETIDGSCMEMIRVKGG